MPLSSFCTETGRLSVRTTKRLSLLAALLVIVLLAAPGCVKNDEIHTLQLEVSNQRRQIQDLKNRQDSNQAQLTEVRPTQANLWAEMEALRVQMAQLGGRMDEQELQLQQLQSQQTQDTQSVATLEEEMAVNKQLWQEAAATLALDLEAMEKLGRRNAGLSGAEDEQQALLNMAAMAANGTMMANATMVGNATAAAMWTGNGTLGNGTLSNGEVATAQSGNATQPQPQAGVAQSLTAEQAAQAIAPNQPKASPADILYQQALTRFKSRDYAKAQRLWQEFSETFKKHKLSPNALFWQGECFFQLKDYARAVLAYQEVISRYPDSTKYRASLLKQGVSFLRLGKKQAGELLLKDVIKKFPDSAEAKRAKGLLNK